MMKKGAIRNAGVTSTSTLRGKDGNSSLAPRGGEPLQRKLAAKLMTIRMKAMTLAETEIIGDGHTLIDGASPASGTLGAPRIAG